MPDEEKKEEKKSEVKLEHVRLTRAEIREVLRCPICKRPGALLDDVCRFCGSQQDESGAWIVPSPEVKKAAAEPKRVPWYEEPL